MSAKIKGYVVLDENGDYNVFINKDLNYEQQMKALAHEVVHINNAHLRVQLPIMECEAEAEKITKKPKRPCGNRSARQTHQG